MSDNQVTSSDFAAAALMAQPFTLYLLVMRWLAPPSEENWARADPILQLLPRDINLWAVPLLGIGLALGWWWLARPSSETLRKSLKFALVGGLIGCLTTSFLRLWWGAHLPAFIPAEENAGPGITLSMTAGYAEELLFRLMLLPALFLWLQPRVSRPLAVGSSIVVSSLGFALLHEAAHPTFEGRLFATRFVVPGCLMGLAALLVNPSFIIGWHCASHLLLPVLFAAN